MLNVRNMKSSKGNLVPNQFVIEVNGCVYFQSYQSIIAKVEDTDKGKELTLGSDWDYSRTTSKYLQLFLQAYCWKFAGLTKKEMQKLIDNKTVNYVAAEVWS